MKDLIDELITVGRKAVAAGLVIGSGGNLSARLPGADQCVVTASGCWLDELTRDDFSVVAITDGRLDFGPWEQIFYGEFDGGRRKRLLIKIIGE